jgi:5-oxoprolinase (ATP-hydrolysing)
MRLASLRTFRHRAISSVLDGALAERLAQSARALAKDAAGDVEAQGGRNVATQATAHIRYAGSDTTLPIPLGRAEEMTERFASTHARQFGFGFENRPLIVESMEIEAWSREAVGDASARSAPIESPLSKRVIPAIDRACFYSQGGWQDCDITCVSDIASGTSKDGPALLIEPHQTIVVEPGWRAEVSPVRAVILTRTSRESGPRHAAIIADPVLLEVMANLFMAIAEEMGATLQSPASSVNSKESLDFSCTVYCSRRSTER